MTQEVSFSSYQKNSFKKMQLNMSTKVGNYVEVSTCHFLRHLCLVSVELKKNHYDGVIMGATASQITSLTIVYSIVYSDADQRKHQSSASLAFVWGIHRGPVNSPHKWPVTRKRFRLMTSSWCGRSWDPTPLWYRRKGEKLSFNWHAYCRQIWQP